MTSSVTPEPSPSTPSVASTRTIGAVTLRLVGDLSADTCPDLEKALADAERERPDLLLADVTAVRSIDWCALTVLLRAKRRARADGRRMQIVDESDPARRLFQAGGRERASDSLRGMLSQAGAVQAPG